MTVQDLTQVLLDLVREGRAYPDSRVVYGEAGVACNIHTVLVAEAKPYPLEGNTYKDVVLE